MAAGIYVIRNLVNGKEYVGQTGDLEQRWREHLKGLKTGRHSNIHLARAAIAYGVDAFKFEVLEEVPDSARLDERELFYGMQRNPAYNIAPFGQITRRNPTGKPFSQEIADRVEAAFHECVAAGGVIMPGDIRRRAGVGVVTTWRVLKVAAWWTPELRNAANAEKWRRALATQEERGWSGARASAEKRHATKRGRGARGGKMYSTACAHRVFQAFAYVRDSTPVLTLTAVAREANTDRQTARRVLRDAGIWTSDLEAEARRNTGKLTATVHRDSQLETLQRGRTTLANQGYPNLRRAQAVNAASGYAGPKKTLAVVRATGANLHAIREKGRCARSRIFDTITQVAATNHGAPVTAVQVALLLGVHENSVRHHLPRMRSEGVIDKRNRPLGPIPKPEQMALFPLDE